MSDLSSLSEFDDFNDSTSIDASLTGFFRTYIYDEESITFLQMWAARNTKLQHLVFFSLKIYCTMQFFMLITNMISV
jgi:hypothetical protein